MSDTTPGGAPPRPGADADWPAKVTDQVVNLVDQIRDKTTGPAIRAARAVVFGFLATMLGTAALVLLIVGLVRFVDVYVPGGVWAAHAIVGGLFVGSGLFLWARRFRPTDSTE